MVSNNIKVKILSLTTIVFLSISFSAASVEEEPDYTTLDKISVSVYCKIATLPFFWFDNYKCEKVEPFVNLKTFKRAEENSVPFIGNRYGQDLDIALIAGKIKEQGVNIEQFRDNSTSRLNNGLDLIYIGFSGIMEE